MLAALNSHGIQIRGSRVSSAGQTSPYADKLTREFLELAYVEEKMSMSAIGRKVACSPMTVRAALLRHGFELDTSRAGHGKRVTLTPQELKVEYLEKGKTVAQIARDQGCSTSPIYQALQRTGIGRVKIKAAAAESADRVEFLRREYSEKGQAVESIAAELGLTPAGVYSALSGMA